MAPELDPSVVIAAGALNLQTVSSSPAVVAFLRSIWNTAISRTMIFSLAMLCGAIPFTLAMEWLNAKRIAEERKKTENVPDPADTEKGMGSEHKATPSDGRRVEGGKSE